MKLNELWLLLLLNHVSTPLSFFSFTVCSRREGRVKTKLRIPELLNDVLSYPSLQSLFEERLSLKLLLISLFYKESKVKNQTFTPLPIGLRASLIHYS